MATTTPLEAGRVLTPRRSRSRLLPILAGSALSLSAASAGAAAWMVNPAVTLGATLSSNPSFMADPKADLVLSVQPHVILRGTGSGFRIDGNVGVEALVHAAGTQTNRLWPVGRLTATAQVVERLAFIEGSFDAGTGPVDPLRSLADVSSQRARYVRGRFSPYLEREISPGMTVSARSDNAFVQTRNGIVAGASGDTVAMTNSARFDMRPEPIGARAEWIDNTTRFVNVAGSRVNYMTGRASLLYALSPDLIVGGIGGVDQAVFGQNDIRQTLTGGSLYWTPTPRSLIDARVEDRFFGRGWDVRVSHRSPFVAFSGEFDKSATTYAAQVASLTAGADVASLLDASLQTRIPNPVDRAVAVQNLITQYGLPTSLANAAVLYTSAAALRQRATYTMVLLGSLHTVTLRLYQQTLRDLLGAGDVAPILSNDSRQRGGSLSITRRLGPESSASLVFSHVQIDGIGANLGSEARSNGVRLSLTQNVNARTSVTGGLRWQNSSANGTLGVSADEVAVYSGVTHRF